MTQMGTRAQTSPGVLGLRVGELVEVRGAEEILATLDERGELENLPFMPEMLAYCGKRLTVHKVAHKVCDTITRGGLFNRGQSRSKRLLPRRLWFREGLRWRFLKGGVVGRTPTAHLDLQPGELVRVKSKEDILATLDENLLNRGMGFDEEMSRYC